jgi:hypothetical protein
MSDRTFLGDLAESQQIDSVAHNGKDEENKRPGWESKCNVRACRSDVHFCKYLLPHSAAHHPPRSPYQMRSGKSSRVEDCKDCQSNGGHALKGDSKTHRPVGEEVV